MAYLNAFEAYNHANQIKSESEQIVTLYLTASIAIKQAKEYDLQKNHDMRYQSVEKAITIFQGLRACIAQENEVSLALDAYYTSLEEMLLTVQCDSKNRQKMFDIIINNIETLKNAWEEISMQEYEKNISNLDNKNDNNYNINILS